MELKRRMVIPMLDLKAQHESISVELGEAIKRVMESQQFILGPEVKELEREIAEYCQVRYAVGCASGSDALLLSLMALGVGEGDEVITTPFTFFATAGSIARLGAVPVFVDIEPGSFNVDPGLVERAVSSKTRAIMPVHLFGQCANMGPIIKLASEYGLAIIEDAAQALGSSYMGRRAGGLGSVAAFSFYPSKNLGGAGDGGIITTDDLEIAESLRALRAHGARKKYFHETVGINSRLDSLQAAILRVKLPYLDEWAGGRRRNAELYRTLFAESGALESGNIVLPVEEEWGEHVYNQFVVRCRDRDSLREYLKENGIGTEIYYPLALHLQQCFDYLGIESG
ncbi:MAG TPA: DegT/DnrJ/EryC1/StrS family aminotransferase, partial [Blastocatellia bacterium]|nr:DegT/DnrJ/EryC1/StrS family aminotransferase [Blastocatellia bacterium]